MFRFTHDPVAEWEERQHPAQRPDLTSEDQKALSKSALEDLARSRGFNF
jgi:hypothetical protein